MRRILALLCFAASLGTAGAAELPSRDAKPPAQKARRCEIAGRPGYLAADGQTCIRISGFVSGQVSGGNLK
jgi:hypothetical protein